LLTEIEEAVKAIQGIPIVQRLPSEPRMTAALDLDAALRKQAQHWCRSRPAIELDFDLRCGGIRTHIDEGWLDIALEKLINNALKAMPNGGHLEVASIFRGRKAEVTITDSGQGISEKVRPYFLKERIPPEFSGSSGTGIGALIAQYIFRAFGGDLELLWSEPGRGTTLRVTLPATPSEAFQTTHVIG
jgi:signal transduction histidine kinase